MPLAPLRPPASLSAGTQYSSTSGSVYTHINSLSHTPNNCIHTLQHTPCPSYTLQTHTCKYILYTYPHCLTHRHTHSHTCSYTYTAHTDTHTHTLTHTQTHRHTHTHTYIHNHTVWQTFDFNLFMCNQREVNGGRERHINNL